MSPLTSCSSVVKKTFEPSLEVLKVTRGYVEGPVAVDLPWVTWVVVPPERS